MVVAATALADAVATALAAVAAFAVDTASWKTASITAVAEHSIVAASLADLVTAVVTYVDNCCW